MEMIFELSTDVTQATLALLSLRDRSPSERQLSEVDTLQPRLTPTPPDDLVNVQHRLAIQIIPLGFIQFDDINRLALWLLVALLPDRLFEFCFGDCLFGESRHGQRNGGASFLLIFEEQSAGSHTGFDR